MAYNRTLQRAGKANQIRPMEEWIVSVGKHPGVISGNQWVQVQLMLEGNRSKNYRHPRSNVALLSGLLVCGKCGDYMRPKMTSRMTADGEPVYSYMCTTKERSRRKCCDIKNGNGNLLDTKLMEEIKKLADDKALFAQLLSQTRKSIGENRDSCDAEMTSLKQKINENENSIKALVNTIAKGTGGAAEQYIMKEIETLHSSVHAMKERYAKLEKLTTQHRFANQEAAFYQQMIESFAASIDQCTVEEKRCFLKSIIRKIVWDGENVTVSLFAHDGEAVLSEVKPSEEKEVPSSADSK